MRIKIEVDTDSKLYALIRKWHYNPFRRFENIAGQEAATEKQRVFILYLAGRHDPEFWELSELINQVWGISGDEWTKADAMFVINALKGIDQ